MSRTRILSSWPDQPLISRVTNEWRRNPHYEDFYRNHKEDEYGQFTSSSSKRPRLRSLTRCCRKPVRLLTVYIGLVCLAVYAYRNWYSPRVDHQSRLDVTLEFSLIHGNAPGSNQPLNFGSLVPLRYLDSKYRPGATAQSYKRLVFVGDVHGCIIELLELLQLIHFDPSSDHLVFTGNMVANGPDSIAVVEIARKHQASCVRGNLEDRLLLAHSSIHSQPFLSQPDESPAPAHLPVTREVQLPLHPRPSQDYLSGVETYPTLIETFSNTQLSWLRQCPVILEIGHIANSHYIVAHAGLAPGVPLDKQDPSQVMTMRTIDLETRVPSISSRGEPWYIVWNHFQKNALPKQRRTTVIYGHDSPRGLQLATYSKGLDTGCVKGGRLTALIVDEKGREKVQSVKCSIDYTRKAD